MAKIVGFALTDEDYEIYKEIKTAILRRYNKLRGVLGHEIINRVYESLESDEKKEKFLKPEKILKKTKNALKDIFFKLPNRGLFPEKLLDRLIETRIGTSEPTKRNYKNIMLGHGIIFNARHSGNEIMLEKGRLPPWLKGD